MLSKLHPYFLWPISSKPASTQHTVLPYSQPAMGNAMESATAADVHQDGHGTTYDQYGRPSWCYKPGPPSSVDLSKLVEGPANGQQYWAQHCSSPGCRSWIWVQKSRDYATCTVGQRPWIQSYLEIGPHYCASWPPAQDQADQGDQGQWEPRTMRTQAPPMLRGPPWPCRMLA